MRASTKRWGVLAALSVLASACSGGSADASEPESSALAADATGAWSSVGSGISLRTMGDGAVTFVAMGGHGTTADHVHAWSEALVRAKLGDLGVGRVIAVAGPNVVTSAGTNLALPALGAELRRAKGAIVVAAHSSGSHVAHAVLNALASDDDSRAVLARTSYVNLDGAGSGLGASTKRALAQTRLVYATDRVAGSSANADSMRAHGSDTDSTGKAYGIVVDGSGCRPAAQWCMHDALTTTRPHDPAAADVARDYVDFEAGRVVQTAWIDALAPKAWRAP